MNCEKYKGLFLKSVFILFTLFFVSNYSSSDVEADSNCTTVSVVGNPICYDTIQEAINAPTTNNNDIIEIHAGTYSETVIVDKEVEINCSTGAVLDGSSISTDNSPATAFTIQANNVTINGCEITGYRKGIITQTNTAYQNITISNNNIHDLAPHSYFNGMNGDYSCRAIDIGKVTDTVLVDSDVLDNGLATISSEPDLGSRLNYSGLTISGNTITGSTNTYSAINLKSISGPVVISNNMITNLRSSGVVLDSVSNVTVTVNTFSNNTFAGIFISDSEDNDSSYNGITPEWWFSHGTDGGYDMWKFGNGSLGPENISIIGNTISGNGQFISWYGGDSYFEEKGNNGITVLSNPNEIEVHNNVITGNDWAKNNGQGGGNGIGNFLPNISDGQVDARNNDWGDSTNNGPRDTWSGDGSFHDTNPSSTDGDYAYGNILYANATLEAEYKLNACFGVTAHDNTNNGHDGNVENGAIWGAGYSRQGLNFDGVDDYIDVGNINLGTVHTISTWVNVTDFSNASQNVVFGNSSNRYALWFQDNDSLYYRAGTDWARFDLSNPLNTGEWYHIVFVRNNTSVELFIDGVSVGVDTFTDNADLIVNYIGKENNGGGTQYPYTGLLDEIRLYNGVLSTAEVNDMYTSYGSENPMSCSVGTPINLGWNLRTQSADSSERPVDLGCGSITNGDYQVYGNGRIAHNWELSGASSGTNYQRQWMWPGSGVWTTDGTTWLETHTGYVSFGGNPGTEGLWNTRVRAWLDINENGTPDAGVDVFSDWSNECELTYDISAPTSTLFIQGDLDETKDLTHNNGWHGYGWYESFDNINLEIATGDIANDFIQYQILNGDVACPAIGDGSYSQVSHNTNVADDINGTDGLYTLCYYAEDAAGNTESSVNKELLHIDDTNPTYTITGANGTIVNDGTRNIHYINTDPAEIYVDVADNLSGYTRARYDLYTADDNWNCTYSHWNQGNLLPPATSSSETLSESGLAEGKYCYRVWVYDDVQNKSWADGNGQQWVYFAVDKTAPTIDDIPDQSFVEGETVNLGFLKNIEMHDNMQLNELYLAASYTTPQGITFTDSDVIDVSSSGGGTGGSMNELLHYLIGGSSIDLSDIDILIDTSIFPEGTYVLEYYVTDVSGHRSDCDINTAGDNNCITTWTIDNIAPSITFGSNQTINEGEAADFTGVFTDPSTEELVVTMGGTSTDAGDGIYDDADWAVSVDYGEGNGYQVVSTATDTGAIYSMSHQYNDAGTYTVSFRVCESSGNTNTYGFEDGEGECTIETVEVTVNNLAPTVNISADPGATVTEGTIVTLTANASSGNPTLSYVWSGDCSGTGATTTVSDQSGTYTCTVEVTDVDGDSTTDSITIQVNQTHVTPTRTTTFVGIGEVLGIEDIAPDVDDADTENDNNTDNTGEVLGIRTCDVSEDVSGYVYIDTNGNDKREDNEDGISNIEVTIYYFDANDKRVDIVMVKTDENGRWKAKLCPGDYKAEIDKTKLPKKTAIEEDVITLTVKKGEETKNINFVIDEVKSFNWWICLIVLLAILLVVVGVGYFMRNKKESQTQKK